MNMSLGNKEWATGVKFGMANKPRDDELSLASALRNRSNNQILIIDREIFFTLLKHFVARRKGIWRHGKKD